MLLEDKLRNLYLGKNKSTNEIAQILKVSERKVHYWLHKYNIPKRSISEAIYVKHNPQGDPFHIKSIKTVEDSKLLGFGLGLYWGEGNKRNPNSIRLGNTNPSLIRKFLEFLIVILGINKNKLRFGLQIFSDIDPQGALNYWMNELETFKIKRNQFHKVIVTPSSVVGTYKEKSKYGVLTVYFCNIKLKKILDDMLPG